MDESEWLACADPDAMLASVRGRVSARKLRLFAAACCRHAWDLIDGDARAAVERLEREGGGSDAGTWMAALIDEQPEGLKLAGSILLELPPRANVLLALSSEIVESIQWLAGWLRWRRHRAAALPARNDTHAALRAPLGEEIRAAREAWAAYTRSRALPERVRTEEWVAQCGLLREILGNPFRPVVFDPAWRTPLVMKFADAITKYRGYDLHPHLAKALKAAGCADFDILSHCREPGEHVPGCWVVDLILGKE